MKNIEEEKIYQKLCLRRDTLKFVMDLRVYGQIASSHDNTDFKVKYYLEHMDTYSGWSERLEDLLKRADKLDVNPNLLDEYQDDLVQGTRELMQECSIDDVEHIKKIEREMNSMLHLCHGAKTLCGELMNVYPMLKKRGDNEVLSYFENAIKYLVEAWSKYDNRSSEYFFLMEEPCYGEWFNDSFKAYFTKINIPLEEHNKNIRHLIDRMKLYNDDWALLKFSFVAGSYASLGVVLDKDYFIDILESQKIAHLKNTLLSDLRKYPSLVPITSEEYLDMLFDDLINKKNEMHHAGNYPFVLNMGNRATWYRLYLKSALKSIVIPLYNMSRTISCEDLTRLFANKIALLENHLEVATYMSDYLKTLTPDYSEIFDEAYLEACEKLPEIRNNFVLTLRQVKEKKSIESTQK